VGEFCSPLFMGEDRVRSNEQNPLLRQGIRCALSQASAWSEGQLVGADNQFHGVSIDSRDLEAGNLFVALKGPTHDGHDHAAAALARGAAGLLVERPLDLPVPQIVVGSTLSALGRLAAAWRAELNLPLVAVTGSNGKTTVKEMIAAILSQVGPTWATRGNLNNHIGVPLTLLSLDAGYRFGVIEMGANHAGEIASSTGLTRPQVAMITNAGRAHLAGFGSLDGVAHAKGEIYGGLASGGKAIVNADDRYAALWHALNETRSVLTFGLGEADVSAGFSIDRNGIRLTVRHPGGRFKCRLRLLGEHNVRNALAATAAALALGVEPAAIAAGLETVRPVEGRLAPRHGRDGARIIDDSYNANPTSLAAAIAVLKVISGRRILVLGDMGELGDGAEAAHAEAGRQAKAAGIDALYSIGPLARAASEAFARGHHFANPAALIAALRQALGPEVTVLVKGSRSSRMEQVVDALCSQEAHPLRCGPYLATPGSRR
jgi:UDP-N-acetylmuramoyl-tripeptide--D-alanyl-D-alanine ligase